MPKPLFIDELFEDKVLSCLIHITDFSVVAAEHLKPSYFTSPIRNNIAKVAIDFVMAYRATPTMKALTDELLKVVKPAEIKEYGDEFIRLRAVDRSDYKWVLEQLIDFIKNRETKKLIEDAVSRHLSKNDFAAIEKDMVRVMAITASAEKAPSFYFNPDEVDKREARREAEYNDQISGRVVGISTGIPAMDKTLAKGGWYRKELYILMAPPKRGKTMALTWFANYAAWSGHNVAFFTAETATEVLSDRCDAMNTMIETKSLIKNRGNVSKLLKARKPSGQLIFFEYPTKSCTVAEIDRQLHKLEVERGVKTNMLVVDYGDILKPSVRYNDRLTEQATIFEELRGLATKWDFPVLTATQINRTGTGKAINDGTDVSGTYEKIMVADCIIALSATEAEMQKQQMRVIFSESRNNEKKRLLIETAYAKGTFYGNFLGEETS